MMMIEQMCRAMASRKSATLPELPWQFYAEEARAALTALLEPSEGMMLAGNIALSNNGVCDTDNDDSRVCVVAAIQAALDEKEGV